MSTVPNDDSKQRQKNNGLRKLCDCPRRRWPKCAHSWYFNFKPKGGPSYRFAVDSEVGKHIAEKGKAEDLADTWRAQIRAGTFRRAAERPAPSETSVEPHDVVTLATFGRTYFERRGKPASDDDWSRLNRLTAFVLDDHALGEKALAAITEDDVELFFAHLRREGLAASTRNKYVQLVKPLFRWATKKGYLARNPIIDTETIKREKHAQRDRRLMPDVVNDKGTITQEGEERRLLAVAEPPLQRRIIAAIETCCRRGELLALQWRDVDLPKRELVVRAEEDGARKTGVGRRLPISARLAAVLDMARTALETMLRSGPAKDLSDRDVAAALGRCYVFGDDAGLKVASFKRSWETAVLKAHGHTPRWTKTRLTAESRAVLDSIDLHFHDLRHEGGSRLIEVGWPLHHVQHMLGHANLAQTSTYLNATRVGLHDSMRRFEVSRLPLQSVATTQEIDHRPDCNEQDVQRTETPVN
jgi:integrase